MANSPLRIESELRLLSLAGKYNINDPADRKRSNVALESLFYGIQDAIKPQCILEIGAHGAAFSRDMRDRHENVPIYAFEANPHIFESMSGKFNFEALNVRYLNLAVSDVTGHTEFQIQKSVDGQPASPIRANNSLLRRTQADVEYEAVRVPSTTLDDFCAAEGLSGRPMSAWIDAEGASEMVLKGASRTLQDIQSIFIEVEDAEFWTSQWRSGHVMDHLMAHGLHPIARDFEYDLQYNVIFVREPVLANGIVRYKLATFLHG